MIIVWVYVSILSLTWFIISLFRLLWRSALLEFGTQHDYIQNEKIWESYWKKELTFMWGSPPCVLIWRQHMMCVMSKMILIR